MDCPDNNWKSKRKKINENLGLKSQSKVAIKQLKTVNMVNGLVRLSTQNASLKRVFVPCSYVETRSYWYSIREKTILVIYVSLVHRQHYVIHWTDTFLLACVRLFVISLSFDFFSGRDSLQCVIGTQDMLLLYQA